MKAALNGWKQVAIMADTGKIIALIKALGGGGGGGGGTTVETVTGTTPDIEAAANHRYICGEVSTLDITVPAEGTIDVIFESGSTPTVLTVTPPTGQTILWQDWFDPTSLEANKTYEINITNGTLAAVCLWG